MPDCGQIERQWMTSALRRKCPRHSKLSWSIKIFLLFAVFAFSAVQTSLSSEAGNWISLSLSGEREGEFLPHYKHVEIRSPIIRSDSRITPYIQASGVSFPGLSECWYSYDHNTATLRACLRMNASELDSFLRENKLNPDYKKSKLSAPGPFFDRVRLLSKMERWPAAAAKNTYFLSSSGEPNRWDIMVLIDESLFDLGIGRKEERFFKVYIKAIRPI